jgi:hypothetical protein
MALLPFSIAFAFPIERYSSKLDPQTVSTKHNKPSQIQKTQHTIPDQTKTLHPGQNAPHDEKSALISVKCHNQI